MDGNIQSIDSLQKSRNWKFWVLGASIVTGLVLSFFSWLELCVEHCSANQDFRLFGFEFAIFGIAFFVTLAIIHFFFSNTSLLAQLVGWMIASALGAELMFIYIQKVQIGHWCPICLSIASTIAFAALVLLTDFFRDLRVAFQKHNKGEIMLKLKRAGANLSFMILGFLMAFVGVTKPDSAAAAINDIKEKVAFGTKNSPVEVYFVSDWFCPSCKKVEPLINKLYPEIKSKVIFYFIDYPIHKKSMNFSPYNLAFMINDKTHYFKARHALGELADKTDSPNDEDLIKIAKKEGLNFKELSFLDVKTGMEFFDKIVDKYDLKSTPTIIITNPRKNSVVKLEGRDEISEERVLSAIDKLSSAK